MSSKKKLEPNLNRVNGIQRKPKPKTNRQQRKRDARLNAIPLSQIVQTIQTAWGCPIKYSCQECLFRAYTKVTTGKDEGYISDEELMKVGKHKLGLSERDIRFYENREKNPC